MVLRAFAVHLSWKADSQCQPENMGRTGGAPSHGSHERLWGAFLRSQLGEFCQLGEYQEENTVLKMKTKGHPYLGFSRVTGETSMGPRGKTA